MPRETKKITVEISLKNYEFLKKHYKAHGSMRLAIDKAISLLRDRKVKT